MNDKMERNNQRGRNASALCHASVICKAIIQKIREYAKKNKGIEVIWLSIGIQELINRSINEVIGKLKEEFSEEEKIKFDELIKESRQICRENMKKN